MDIVAVASRCALHLVRSPGHGGPHLELTLLLADVSAAKEAGADPAADDGDKDDNDHDNPFVMRVQPGTWSVRVEHQESKERMDLVPSLVIGNRGRGSPSPSHRRSRARGRRTGGGGRGRRRIRSRARSSGRSTTKAAVPGLDGRQVRGRSTARAHCSDASGILDLSEHREARVTTEAVIVDGWLGGRSAASLDVPERTTCCSARWQSCKGYDGSVGCLGRGRGYDSEEGQKTGRE